MIFGLGNPGDQYARTRHNVGFQVVDKIRSLYPYEKRVLTAEEELFFLQRENNSGMNTEKCICLCKPQVFMNRSGIVVRSLLKYFGLPISSALILVDDFSIPLGTIRLRGKGSCGGHNGLGNIEECLGTNKYQRIRVGIGHQDGSVPVDILGFVLGTFENDEQKQVEEVVTLAASVTSDWICFGMDYCQNQYNRQTSRSAKSMCKEE